MGRAVGELVDVEHQLHGGGGLPDLANQLLIHEEPDALRGPFGGVVVEIECIDGQGHALEVIGDRSVAERVEAHPYPDAPRLHVRPKISNTNTSADRSGRSS